MSENSRKSANIIPILALAAVLGVGWFHFNERIEVLDSRVNKLEAESRVLAPLLQVMGAVRPNQAVPHAYAAIQATGPANVPNPGADSPLAWCSAAEDGGPEWLELRYEKPVMAAELRIQASFNPGAVVRVLVGTDDGDMRELWAGVSPAETVQTLAISPPAEITRVKLELDTAKVPGWNEIDAVALVGGAGVLTWANEATGSSVWTKPAK